MKSALFFDLGGTLVKIQNDEIYLSPHGLPELLPNVKETIASAREDLFFVVTNQSAISRGLITHANIRLWIDFIFKDTGKIAIDFWACPFPQSTYRKPSSAMILGLIDKHYVDPLKSSFVGDTESDRQAALGANLAAFYWASDFFKW